MMPRGSRLRLAVLALFLVAERPLPARAAEPDKARCKASYETAQVLKREEHLDAARTQLAICRETCPGPLAAQCAAWETEIDALVPTVRIAARDRTGATLPDVRVSVDGRVLPSIEGPIPVDPGAHVFRFEPRRGPPVETKEEIHSGEREHLVTVVLEPPPGAPSEPPPAMIRARSATPSWILGGVGVAAFAVAGGLAVKGQLDKSSLESDCAPFCGEDDVNAIRTLWWTSAGLAAVGTIAIAAAVILWPRAPTSRTASILLDTATLRWRFR